MEPENQPRPLEPESAMHDREVQNWPGSPSPASPPQQPPGPIRIFIGSGGLRAGWSLLIAMLLYRIIRIFLGSLTVATYPAIVDMDFSPTRAIIEESIPLSWQCSWRAWLSPASNNAGSSTSTSPVPGA